MTFTNRTDAGKQLAAQLQQYAQQPDTIVVGLPRGGVVVAYEVALELQLPLDIVVPRKIGAPFDEELAVGAISQDGHVVWNNDLMKSLDLTPGDLTDIIAKEKAEAIRRVTIYRAGRNPLKLTNKTVILVDDGIATGATMHAAIMYVRAQNPAHLIVAIPVAPVEALKEIAQGVDQFVCLNLAKTFMGVGAFYQNFEQTTDEEVINLLAQAEQ